MISGNDIYTVLTAMVPLYVAMFLAYGSVRWWRIFTPDQCSGINRFVAIFAVPLLSFHFISTNDPYAMNLRFLAADTLQKLLVLSGLAVWSRLLPSRLAAAAPRLDWSITLFSVSTLPNTLVMGIPLLIAMYGPYAGSLMVQVIVLQCIIWYTLLLFLFEFRAARVLIAGQFPAGTAAACIADVRVDPDVVSLAGSQAEAQAEVAPDGRMRLVVRRSTSASRRSLAAAAATPRPSNLTGVEIYSLRSSRNATPRGSSGIAHADIGWAAAAPPHGASSLRMSSFGAADLFSLHPTPRPSSFDEQAVRAGSAATVAPSNDPRDVHMIEWSSGASTTSEVRGLPVFHGGDLHRGMDSRRLVPSEAPPRGQSSQVNN